MKCSKQTIALEIYLHCNQGDAAKSSLFPRAFLPSARPMCHSCRRNTHFSENPHRHEYTMAQFANCKVRGSSLISAIATEVEDSVKMCTAFCCIFRRAVSQNWTLHFKWLQRAFYRPWLDPSRISIKCRSIYIPDLECRLINMATNHLIHLTWHSCQRAILPGRSIAQSLQEMWPKTWPVTFFLVDHFLNV